MLSKYKNRQMVRCQFKNAPDTTGKIIAIKWIQLEGYRPDVYSISYCVEPESYIGYEHDEEEWIPECHDNCIPRIFGAMEENKMWRGTLTQLVKSEASQLRTPGQATEVRFDQFPTEGQRFDCFGESLTEGGDFRWISTSPVVALTPYGSEGTANTFTTESGSEYRLETFSG